ncbi:MAG: S1 RNA-binding domain-containing protein [Candidatus Latescibacteria bacterium]|nr:S1 RNA-binding domain-containing protein [Candidatus Latescibacterota bacterium]
MSQPPSQDSPADNPSGPEPQEATSPQTPVADGSGTLASADETPSVDGSVVAPETSTPPASTEPAVAAEPTVPATPPPTAPPAPVEPEAIQPPEESPAPATEPPVTPPASEAPVAVAPAATPPPTAPPAPVEPAASQPPEESPAPAAAAPTVDMNALLDQQAGADAGVLQVKVGDRVSGVLVRLGEENCFVDFGGRSEGMIRTTEMKGEDGELAFKVGEPLEAFVVSDADSVVLSRFVSGEARQADTLYKAYKAGIPIEGKVMAVNKWGIGVDLEGMRAFCPVSQVDTQFTKDLEQYRDKKMTFKIIRFRDHGRSIVLSRRALLEAEQEKDAVEIREKIVDGTQLTGTVTRLENFGAFVDVGSGVEGLIHVSEMRHERVNHPKDVVQPGEEVTVKVIAVKNLGDRRKERISLSIKALEKDPWDEVRSQFPAGTVTMGKIEGVEEYGAFVELAPNVRGLIHVSELAERRVNHPRDVVSVGEEVKVAVMEVDNKRKRLRLSIRRAEQVEGATNLKEFAERQRQEKESEGSANTAMLDALKRAKLVE